MMLRRATILCVARLQRDRALGHLLHVGVAGRQAAGAGREHVPLRVEPGEPAVGTGDCLACKGLEKRGPQLGDLAVLEHEPRQCHIRMPAAEGLQVRLTRGAMPSLGGCLGAPRPRQLQLDVESLRNLLRRLQIERRALRAT